MRLTTVENMLQALPKPRAAPRAASRSIAFSSSPSNVPSISISTMPPDSQNIFLGSCSDISDNPLAVVEGTVGVGLHHGGTSDEALFQNDTLGSSRSSIVAKDVGQRNHKTVAHLLMNVVTIKDFKIRMEEVLTGELKHSSRLPSLHITTSISRPESMEMNSCHFTQKSRA